ncbi:MAG: hypothetical protein H7068_03650 [Pedobacter sp.]|nr:hypothetical protein [Chitinophagaceae bacterium]
MNDYFPRSNAEQVTWLTNFKTKIATTGVTLGLTPAQITTIQNHCTSLIAAISNVETKKTDLAAAVKAKEIASQTDAGALRIEVARYKTLATYLPTMGQDLGIIGTATTFDAASYKAKITAEMYAGFVRVKFTKNGTDGVNIYHRQKGEVTWQFLARDTKSPYDDHIVLATAGIPEHWEYRAFGVINDLEIGQPSDIVEMVYGG